MRLVLEKKQPFFGSPVNVYVHVHSTGIYFFRLVETVKLAALFKCFRAYRCNIHKRNGLCHVKLFSEF